jgi:hypothetical protein
MAMADVGHAAKLREGTQAWNLWRAQNPGVAPDLSDLKLPAGSRRFGPDQGGPIDLSRTNLRRAVLAGADLLNARLDDADLSGADLRGANLGQSDLAGALLVGANLTGAWLGNARGLTQAQIDRATGQRATVLPDYLAVPAAWIREEPAAAPPDAAQTRTDKSENRADNRADKEADEGADKGAGRSGKADRGAGVESDPYSILGISRKASQSEIRAAYLRLVKELHPDGRAPGVEADVAAERLKLINDAYQTLKGADWQASARKAKPRHRTSAVVFVAGVMTAMAPLLAAGLYVVWRLRVPTPTTTVAVSDRPGSAGGVARDAAPETTGAGTGSVHVKEVDGGRSRALAAARRQATREAWEQLVVAFPDGETAAEARTALAAIERTEARRRQEAADWAKVETSRDKQALQRFVLAYPESANAVRARKTIAAIEQAEARRRREAIDWAKAEASGDKQELQRFAAAYPDGTHVGRAREMIATIERAEARRREEEIAWANAERSNNRQELKRFVAAHPDSAHAGRAREMIAAIDLAETRRREAADWAEAQTADDRQELERFARAHPHSVYAPEARRRVAVLEAEERRKDDADWDKAARHHNRAAYTGYLTRNPNGQHVADANRRLADLARAESRVEPVKAAVAEAPTARQRSPEAIPGWPSADEPFIGADGRIRR